MRRFLLLLLLLTLPAGPVAAQSETVAILSRHVLTNDGVVALAKAGFDELFIIERIRTSRTHFDTTVEGLVALKQAGLSDDLIREIAAHDTRAYPAAVEAAPAGVVQASPVRVERHWWGMRWVRVTR